MAPLGLMGLWASRPHALPTIFQKLFGNLPELSEERNRFIFPPICFSSIEDIPSVASRFPTPIITLEQDVSTRSEMRVML